MESAERVLQLFDAYWFNHDILANQTLKLGDISDHQGLDQEPGAVTLSKLSSFYIRSSFGTDQYLPGSKHGNSFISTMSMTSFSDQLDRSPKSVLMTPRAFQRSLSGKEVDGQKQEEERKEGVKQGWKRRGFARRKKEGGGRSKSLSELEFEELKGFMDLGFVFSEEDKDSRLASILPGLQRLQRRIKEGDHTSTNRNDGTRDRVIDCTTTAGSGVAAAAGEQEAEPNNIIKRPYLSEAWGWGTYNTRDESKVENLMLLMNNWRLPSLRNEADMKNHLKLWAHTVASTLVR